MSESTGQPPAPHNGAKSDAKSWQSMHQALLIESTLQLRKKQANTLYHSWGGWKRDFYYVLSVPESRQHDQLIIQFFTQTNSPSRRSRNINPTRMSWRDILDSTDSKDREILQFLVNEECGLSPITNVIAGMMDEHRPGYYRNDSVQFKSYEKAALPIRYQKKLLKLLAETGRFIYFSEDPTDKTGNSLTRHTLRFDDGEPWKLKIQVVPTNEAYSFRGKLVRGTEELDLQEALLCLKSGIVLLRDQLACLESLPHYPWIAALLGQSLPPVPASEMETWLEGLAQNPYAPWFELPELPAWRKQRMSPVPHMVFAKSQKVRPEAKSFALTGQLRFTYGSHEVSALSCSSTIVDTETRTLINRDREQEDECLRRVRDLDGIHPHWRDDISNPLDDDYLRVFTDDFPHVVSTMLSWGWQVDAHGKKVRPGAGFSLKVSSGIDWFGLQGEADFGDKQVMSVPELIAAIDKGETLIPLGDGTFGVLPEIWLKRVAPLAQMGELTSAGIRFRRAQGILLNAWLVEAELLRTADADFSRLTEQLKALANLKPCLPPPAFRGVLRSYQQEGLSWLKALKEAGLGGILADDMGLGKTVQVLSHLMAEHRGDPAAVGGPSLIVVPKTLLFNWQEEAKRFTPDLKVVVYAGASSERARQLNKISEADIVLTTYPALRQDIELLKAREFHYVIADEANAIKNSESQANQACRLIRARHRVALTGTPVENSVDDLFALLEFVMPGLISGKLRERFKRKKAARTALETDSAAAAAAAASGDANGDLLRQLARALKPFILRRTKAQVLVELPEKSEEILYCELGATEMKRYRELRDYYRKVLKKEIDRQGLARSKIIVLEALLRLRQAACHPGLLDLKRTGSESAKLEILMERLAELIAEGHKTLVFSQFTSFLDIIETALSKAELPFERLDGQTSSAERQASVTRFQDDESAKVFLLSLKAGGVGLNLTAADYVFLMDPWWNPAAESQAIDRTYRIGQKNKVTAYRLISRGTVEEKIIELQSTKKDLAEALISADANLIRTITPEDIEILLS